MSGAADALDDDGHLLLSDKVPAGLDISSAACEIGRGIDALYGLGNLPEHPVLVLDKRTHVCGIHSRKRLIITVFQFRAGPDSHGAVQGRDERPQLLQQFSRKDRGDEL